MYNKIVKIGLVTGVLPNVFAWQNANRLREDPQRMKLRRFVTVLLAVLTVTSTLVFTGCSSGDKAAATTSTRDIVALNMYIITEDTTTKEASDKVEMAINEILLPNYKTLIKINYLTRDEYWDAVDEAIEKTSKMSTTKGASVKGTENLDFPSTIEYIFDESTTDIELTADQIDIFVIDDYDKYLEYAGDGKLKGLGEYISYDSKKLSTNIYPTLMAAVKVDGETYGVPTNFAMDIEDGTYTYLVYNCDLLEKYGFVIDGDTTTMATKKFANFMQCVKDGESGIWSLSEPFGVSGAEYYNGEEAFMAVANEFNQMASGATPTIMTKSYTDNIKKTIEYAELGYYPTNGEAGANAKYAVRVEKSDRLLDGENEKQWTDEDGTRYARYLFDIPRVTAKDAFSSVMCVSATSPVPERAMEIITLFQTNFELANLLQYGIYDVNYQIDERDDSIILVDDTYAMNNIITGNTYIKYSPDNDKNYLENTKNNNLGVAPSNYLAVDFGFDNASDSSKYEIARTIILTAVDAIKNGADVNEILNTATRELENLGCTRASAVDDYGGIFGRIQSAQRQQGQIISQNFALSEAILSYNDVYDVKRNVDADEEVNVDGEENADEVIDEQTDGENAEETEE